MRWERCPRGSQVHSRLRGARAAQAQKVHLSPLARTTRSNAFLNRSMPLPPSPTAWLLLLRRGVHYEPEVCGGLPLYRQEAALARLGSNSRVRPWPNGCSPERVGCRRSRSDEVHLLSGYRPCGQTTPSGPKEEGREAQSKSYLWLIPLWTRRTADRFVRYQPTREGTHPRTFLRALCYLHVDACGL